MSVVTLTVDVVFWASLFLGTALLLFTQVYSVVLFSDLRRDHINPTELCDHINRIVPLEHFGHAALVVVLVLRGFFVSALLHTPLVAFHVQRRKARQHLLDNTSIFRDMVPERAVSERKIIFYLANFFLYLYFFILYCIEVE